MRERFGPSNDIQRKTRKFSDVCRRIGKREKNSMEIAKLLTVPGKERFAKTLPILGLLAVMFVGMGPASSGCPTCKPTSAARAASEDTVRKEDGKVGSFAEPDQNSLGWGFHAKLILARFL